MTKPRYSVVLSCGLMLIVSSCTTLDYTYKQPSTNKSNGIVEFEKPRIEQKLNWLGYGTAILGGSLGGYVGYHSGMSIDGEVKPTSNATVGFLVGGLVAIGSIFALAPSVSLSQSNAADWVAHIDRELRYVSSVMGDSGRMKSITTINRYADSSFVITSLEDARLFKNIFGLSPYRSRVVERAVYALPRPQLLNLDSIFDAPEEEATIRSAFISRSRSVRECVDAAAVYPVMRDSARVRANAILDKIPFVLALDTAQEYSLVTEYGRSSLADRAQTEQECQWYLAAFPNAKESAGVRARLVSIVHHRLNDIRTVEECAAIAREYPELATEADQRAGELAVSLVACQAYLKAFPTGGSVSSIRARYETGLVEVRRQVDQDLVRFGGVVTEYRRHVSRLATGVRSAADDIRVVVEESDGLYRRLERNERFMTSNQKSLYRTHMDSWEQSTTWLYSLTN